jgi:hypothetical protein
MSTATLTRPQQQWLRSNNERLIERAGECLDGDDCPRYHCRECGAYWLGDLRHICRAAPPDLEQHLLRWMEEALAIEQGGLSVCARLVLLRVKAAGLGEAFLDTFGPDLIKDLWESHGDDDAEDHAAVRRDHAPTRPGVRRVNVEQLSGPNGLLESLLQVGGEWVRLGDLDKRQCRAIQHQHKGKAAAFGKVAASLSKNQTVGERWTAEQLEAQGLADTLRGAAPVRPT